MAMDDEQKRRSYFPAANQYAGAPANVQRAAARNLGQIDQGISRRNALRAPQQPNYAGGSIYNPTTGEGVYGSAGVPQQNMTTYTLPSGGTASIPTGTAPPANSVAGGSARFNPLSQQNIGEAYARGYGAAAPTVQGGYLTQGGVATPAESLSPQQRTQYGLGAYAQYGAGTFGERFREQNPLLGMLGGALGTFGYNAIASIGKMFGGGQQQRPLINQNPYAFNAPRSQPRRYFDDL